MSFQLGLDSFGDVVGGGKGDTTHAQTLREVIAEAELADELGLDFFGFGEHHRDDMAISAPDIMMARLAGSTSQIRLGTSVIVLSSDDPVRVYQRFATMAAFAPGRIEATVGRGSFTESFPLFGYHLSDYDRLFEEKFDLLAKLAAGGPVDWSGTIRPPLKIDTALAPHVEDPFTLSVGVGGIPASIERAARYGLPLVMAIIGGSHKDFKPHRELYRQRLAQHGFDDLPVAVSSFGHIAATDEQAEEELMPHLFKVMTQLGIERGWPPLTKNRLRVQFGQYGSAFVGSPETVANKIISVARSFDFDRLQLKYGHGDLPHDLRMESIRLYAQEVAPRVREALG